MTRRVHLLEDVSRDDESLAKRVFDRDSFRFDLLYSKVGLLAEPLAFSELFGIPQRLLLLLTFAGDRSAENETCSVHELFGHVFVGLVFDCFGQILHPERHRWCVVMALHDI